MKNTPHLQTLITQIAQKYGYDLNQTGAQLRLQLAPNHCLKIRAVAPNHLVVIQSGEPLQENPEVAFFLGNTRWIPLSIRCPGSGTREYAVLDAAGAEPLINHRPEQAMLAHLCELWALELEREGWLEKAVVA